MAEKTPGRIAYEKQVARNAERRISRDHHCIRDITIEQLGGWSFVDYVRIRALGVWCISFAKADLRCTIAVSGLGPWLSNDLFQTIRADLAEFERAAQRRDHR